MEEENNAVTEWSKFDYQDVVLGNISVVSFAEREREKERERGGGTVPICINNVFKCRQMSVRYGSR